MNSFLGRNYPRRWSEMALDFKLMFGLHGAVMIMFAAGRALTIAAEITFDAILIVAAVIIAVRHRQQRGWRWARPGPKQYLLAAGSVGATLLFCAAVLPNFPADNPNVFPWYLALGQIGVFNTLCALRLARLAEQDFAADCGRVGADASPTSVEAAEETWPRRIRLGYGVLFVAVWLEALAFFYVHGTTLRHGSQIAVEGMDRPITEHGATVYVAAGPWALDHALMIGMMTGIPAVLLLGAVLQYVVGIPALQVGPRPRG